MGRCFVDEARPEAWTTVPLRWDLKGKGLSEGLWVEWERKEEGRQDV